MAVYRMLLPSLLLVLPFAQAGGGNAAVTPVEKVIKLIEDLKTQCEEARDEEGKVYGEFACFCKDTTEKKATSIKDGEDNIDSLSAEIEAKTAEQAQTEDELQAAIAKKAELEQQLADSKAQMLKQQMEYEAEEADLSKAISSLESAIKSLEEAKPSLLQSVHDSLKKTLALADALSLIDHHKVQAVATFLQVDPSNPEYEYHSQGIIDIMDKLLKEYREKKSQLDAEWEKTKTSFEELHKSLASSIEEKASEITTLGEKIEKLKGEIASARESLVEAEAMLKDDQLYMKDLTKQCEDRANDFDQRSAERENELKALTEALEILKGKVQSVEGDRALIQEASHGDAEVEEAAPSFLQVGSPRARAVSLLERGRGSVSASEARKARVVALLNAEGKRLNSAVLTSLAMHAAADPFAKVKELIQKLIERLVREATAEATKKGFCDTELGKAESDRDYRIADVKKLNAEIYQLEIKQDELEAEIDELKKGISDNRDSLEAATKVRGEQKAVNLQDIEDAKAGLEAVTEALAILKTYYRKAARKTVLLEASPLDEDTEGAGFEGAYQGNQAASKGIIGLLEVIKSDFERTIGKTTAAENQASADHVLFDRGSKADTSGKETKQELDEADLVTTKANIEKKSADLKLNMDMLDDALKAIEALKPTCIDTGMSYEERVAKREEEMEALKKALCILDTDGVEADCA